MPTQTTAAHQGMTYEQSGVNYDPLDRFKRLCQAAAARTRGNLQAHGFKEPKHIRGESAYLVEGEDEYIAHVEEGLGTKNLVADAMLKLTGVSNYENIGICTVATIVNDIASTGASPISVAMHCAVGDGNWLNGKHAEDLARGFAAGCQMAGAVWGGGETPALKGIVDPNAVVLAGSAIGRIRPKSLRVQGDLQDGDVIILLASSGVQTNGLSLCRALAARIRDGYLTETSDNRSFGEALLDPSVIYVDFVKTCQRLGIQLKYLSHISGHGWRKIMRLEEPFVYRMHFVPEPQPVFKFIQEHGPVELREMYATFNMGVGFAAYVSASDADLCVRAAKDAGYDAWVGGTVHKHGSRKAVEILPLGLTFEGETLQVR